jgi:hypothetical protein
MSCLTGTTCVAFGCEARCVLMSPTSTKPIKKPSGRPLLL